MAAWNMSHNKSSCQVAIPCVLVKFRSFIVLHCQYGAFWLSIQLIWIEPECRLWIAWRTYDWNSSISMSPQDGQSCSIDCWTSQFSNIRLCLLRQLCDLSYCQTVFRHWAGLVFWWMAKNLMTNDADDGRVAGLLNSSGHLKSPQRNMSRIISTNRTFQAYIHWRPPSIEDDMPS